MVDMRRQRLNASCGCVVDYEWDNDVAQASRAFRIVVVYKTDEKHATKLQIGQDPFQVLDI